MSARERGPLIRPLCLEEWARLGDPEAIARLQAMDDEAATLLGCDPPPLCPKNPDHGRLIYSPPGTPEQKFTHISWHCPAGWPSHCSGDMTWPTFQLIAWYEEQGWHEGAAQLRRAWEPG